MDRIRVVEVLGDSKGGGTDFALNLIDSLDPARFAVTLIGPEAQELAQRSRQSGATYYPLALRDSRISWAVRERLGRLLSAADADIIHTHGTRAAWYTMCCLPLRSRRSAFFYSEHAFAFDGRRGVARLPWYAVEYAICRRADAVLTGAPFNGRRLLAMRWLSPERLANDRNGFALQHTRDQVARPVAREALGAPADALLVGSVGRLVPQKGWPYLLEAFAEVARACPAAYLLIVGGGEQLAQLEAQARRLGIAQRVRFLGAQPNPWSWLVHCDLFVGASLWEGEWVTPLEALVARLPVIVTRVGGAEDYIEAGQTGLFVPPRDATALAEALLALLRDPAKRAAMAAAPRDIVAEYDIALAQRAIAALYERTAAQIAQGRGDGGARERPRGGARHMATPLNHDMNHKGARYDA